MNIAGRPVIARVSPRRSRGVGLVDARDGTTIAAFGIEGLPWGDLTASDIYQVDGRPILVIAGDGIVQQWDLLSAERAHPDFGARRRWPWRSARPAIKAANVVNAVTAYHDGDHVVLLIGDSAGLVRRYDAATGREIGEPLRNPAAIQSLAVYRIDGVPHVACGDTQNSVWRWEARSGRLAGTTGPGLQAWVRHIVPYEAEGRVCLAVGSNSSTVQRLDAATGARIGALLPHEDSVADLCVSHSGAGSILVVASEHLHLYDAVSGERLGEPAWRSEDVPMAVCTLDVQGRTALFVADSQGIWRFDASSGELWPG